MTQISDLVLALLTENPSMSNQAVADKIIEANPGARTSAASVSSIKSNMKKAGIELPSAGSSKSALNAAMPTFTAEELPEEDEDTRSVRIRRRFGVLYRMAVKVSQNMMPALIVSGPPGLGKSFTVEQVLQEAYGDPTGPLLGMEDHDAETAELLGEAGGEGSGEGSWDIISGSITPPGLILALWAARNGGVLVLDDCDDVFRDEGCLNLLKAVLDSSSTRRVSYRKRAAWMDEFGIPQTFEFNGSVVFCTNIDFEAAISKGTAMGPHFEALIDRSHYLSLTMRTEADFITRIRQVAIEDGLLNSKGLDDEQAQEVFEFIVENRSSFYGLSLRLVGQVADAYVSDPDTWKDDIEATKMRTFR